MGEPEVCVFAAIRLNDGPRIQARRHHECLRLIAALGLSRHGAEQGFVTNHGRFVDRLEGRRLQDAAGIPSAAEGGYRGEMLFSEDLPESYEPGGER